MYNDWRMTKGTHCLIFSQIKSNLKISNVIDI